MKTDKYYFLTIKNYLEIASAFAPEDVKLSNELIPELDGKNELPFSLQLVKLSVRKKGLIKSNDLSKLDNIWLDFQPNSLAWPLMSEKFKKLITENLTGNESVNWISVQVNGICESRLYYIIRFEKMLDVLDVNQTIYVKGTDRIITPYFDMEKVKNYTIFHKPMSNGLWKITSGLYISEKLKQLITKEKLIGPAFERVRVSRTKLGQHLTRQYN
jgi:hypothetical protein